jgi:hypothetical protein
MSTCGNPAQRNHKPDCAQLPQVGFGGSPKCTWHARPVDECLLGLRHRKPVCRNPPLCGHSLSSACHAPCIDFGLPPNPPRPFFFRFPTVAVCCGFPGATTAPRCKPQIPDRHFVEPYDPRAHPDFYAPRRVASLSRIAARWSAASVVRHAARRRYRTRGPQAQLCSGSRRTHDLDPDTHTGSTPAPIRDRPTHEKSAYRHCSAPLYPAKSSTRPDIGQNPCARRVSVRM